MSAALPPLPLIEPPITPRQPSVRLAALWLFIVLAVAMRVTLHYLSTPDQQASAAHAASAFELEINGRNMVGMHALIPPAMAPKITDFETTLEKSAGQDTTNQIRAIMVEAELSGSSAAADKLGVLASKTTLTPEQRQDIQTLLQMYKTGSASLDLSTRTRLLSRYDWFAQLALSYDLPANDPQRTAVMAPAVRTLVSVVIMALLAMSALGVGLVLLILAIIFLKRKSIRPRYVPMPQPDVVFLESFAIYLGGMILISIAMFVAMRAGWHPPDAISWLILITFPLPLAWPSLRGLPWKTAAQRLGLFAPRGVVREIGAGLAGFVIGLPIMAIGMLVTYVLVIITGIRPIHPIVFEAKDGPWMILQMFLLASVWAPITEELMFRGALFGHLRQKFGWLVSASVVAVIFASLHPQGWVAIPALAAIAIVLAGIREWRGSIIGCIAAHALNNTVVLIMLVLIAG